MSGPQYLLDTNICIYIAKHRPAHVRARFAQVAPSDLAMSAITYGELRHGAEKSQAREKALQVIDQLKGAIQVLELSPAAGDQYGRIRAFLEKWGTPIGNNDLWIAAHALALGCTLVTNNVREFERIPSLSLENWVEE